MKPEHFDRCQVETPEDVVSLLWKLAKEARGNKPFRSVLELGAGDARFALSTEASFLEYTGIEKDAKRIGARRLPNTAQVFCGDAMTWVGQDYDLVIGNPPYIRHHHLDPTWRANVGELIRSESGVQLKRTANLFVLFMMKALLSAKPTGMVVQLVPFEWVTRPSALELREYIRANDWSVRVYRFSAEIFPTVLTTAALVLIDKAQQGGSWKYGEIGRNGEIRKTPSPSGNTNNVLPYQDRQDELHTLRGLSPGGQEIFVLTEQERLHFSLKKGTDVAPCVTSLRSVGTGVTHLTKETFKSLFVDAGARCWLIRSDRSKRSPELQAYLASVGDKWKKYSTCTTRQDWAKYRPHPAPALLISSGFVGTAPKMLHNDIHAVAAGSVYGIFSTIPEHRFLALVSRLRVYDFSKRLVHHANNLRKLEVRQLNSVLQRLNS